MDATRSARARAAGGVAVALAIAWASAGTARAQGGAPPVADWAVLVYMAADTNLEDATLGNLEEILDVGGSTPRVRVITLVDRSTKGGEQDEQDDGYTNRAVANLPDWSGAKLLEPLDGELRELADWGPTNMGDPAVLRRFIEEATKAAPARRYLLILSDHGAGWSGVCFDDSAEGDGLTLDDLTSALRATARSVPRWELIGHDACLMATYEVFSALAPFASVQVASEETIPGDGWNYVTTLRQLRERPEMDGAGLGRGVADSYRDYFGKSQRDVGRVVTLSVVRSDRMPMLGRALGAFAGGLHRRSAAGGPSWWKVAHARASAEDFGGRSDGLIDLAHLAELVADEFKDDAEMKAQASAVVAEVTAAVSHNVRGKDRPNAHGISIYFPATASALAGDPDDASSSYGKVRATAGSPWFPMLSAFTEVAAHQPARPVLGEVRGSARSVNAARNVTVKATVDADDCQEILATVARTIEGGGREVVAAWSSRPNDDGALEEEWDGTGFVLRGEKDREIRLPVVRREWTSTDDDGDDDKDKDGDKAKKDDADPKEKEEVDPSVPVSYHADVQVRRGGKGAWTTVSLVFAPDDGDDDEHLGNLDGAWTVVRAGGTSRPVTLRAGDQIRPLTARLDASGRLVEAPDPDAEPLVVRKAAKLQLRSASLDPGPYALGYTAVDSAGHSELRSVPVSLEP